MVQDPDSTGDVVPFATCRDVRAWRGQEHARDRVTAMTSALSQLEYLHREAIRLRARMSAHLIGAAAESLRREIAQSSRGG